MAHRTLIATPTPALSASPFRTRIFPHSWFESYT